MELQRRIEKLTTSQLKRLDSWLHQLIADRETEIEEQHHKGREVLARVVKPGGTMQLEMVRCGKAPRCKSCPHGPYWYRYWKESGRTRSKYVGKSSRADKIRFADEIGKARRGDSASPVITASSTAAWPHPVVASR